MPITLEKVTIFITRVSGGHQELLLFQHPHAGVQIPAGTVEPGETPEAAARREATEETGLTDLVLRQCLGNHEEPPAPGHVLVAAPTPVYARPDPGSFDWARFRSGLEVRLLRRAEGFSQVSFREPDKFPDPSYTTYAITGWVPEAALTTRRQRHFFHFIYDHPASAAWTVRSDNHSFRLFWADLQDLPAIVAAQRGWLDYLPR